MDKIIKALLGLIFALIVVIGVFGILPQLGIGSPFAGLGEFQNPLAELFQNGKNAGASKTGSTDISYGSTDATITTYDDPSVVTVEALGQDITLAVPDSAQSYLPFLGYLG